MASEISDVVIKLSARNTLGTDLKSARNQLSGFARDTEGTFGRLNSSIRSLTSIRSLPVIATVTALGTALGYATKRALDFGGEIVDSARAVDVSTDALQELRFAASQTGTDIATLDRSLSVLAKNQGEAAAGNKRSADAFRRLGVDIRDANGNFKTTDELFTEVIARIGELDSAAERAEISRKLLGGGFIELSKLAREGAGGIQALRDQAHELGVVIDEETLAAAEEAGDKFDALFTLLKIEGVQAVLAFAPELTALAETFSALTRTVSDFLDQFRDVPRTIDGVADHLERARRNLSTAETLEALSIFGGPDSPQAKEVERLRETVRVLERELERRAFTGRGIDSLEDLVTPANPTPRAEGSSRLLPVRDEAAERRAAREAEKEAARLARDRAEAEAASIRAATSGNEKVIDLAERRIEAEIRLAEAAGDEEAANRKRIELIQRRFEIERAEILRTVQDTEASAKAIEDLGATRDAEIATVAEKATDAFEGFGDFIKGGLAGAFADLAITGEISFESLGNAFLREFIQRSIEGLFELEAAMSAVEGIGAFIGSFVFGGAATAVPAATGGIFTKPTLVHLAEGGEAEGVFPLSQLNRFMGSQELKIEVINNASDQVGVDVRRNPSTKRTEIVIDRRIAQGVRSAQGGEALQDIYGVPRQGRRRV